MKKLMAIAAAFLLALQMLGSAHAAGSMPLGPMLDAFGNPLCISGYAPDDPQAPERQGLPGCCLLGCAFNPGGFAPGSPQAPTPIDHGFAVVTYPPLPLYTIAALAHDPGAARAPPPRA